MFAQIDLTSVQDVRDLHEAINAELRLRRVAPTLEALREALENPRCEADIDLIGYGKITGALYDYVNTLIEMIVIVGEKNQKIRVTITM